MGKKKSVVNTDESALQQIIIKLFKAMDTIALINSTKDLTHLIVLILHSIKEVMGVEASSLAQVDDDSDELYFSEAAGGSEKIKGIRLKIGEGIAGHVALTKQPLLVNDVTTNKYHYKNADQRTDFVTKSILCVPLIVREKVIGVIQALNKIDDLAFDSIDLKIFTTFANQVAVALENARLYKLAVYDGLTEIFDRRYFDFWITTEYARVKRYKTKLSFIIFDIDFFKNVNDKYGHQAGDFILKTVSALIRSHIRKADLFARYGGEEFVLVLPETEMKYAVDAAEKYRELISDYKFIYNEQEIMITISFGVSSYQETPEDTVEKFIENADKMLYKAKNSGRNRVCAYWAGEMSK